MPLNQTLLPPSQLGGELESNYPARSCQLLPRSGPARTEGLSAKRVRFYWLKCFTALLWRGFVSAILRGYGFGSFVGDGFQLGGAFLVENGRISKSSPAKDAADKVPFECILE